MALNYQEKMALVLYSVNTDNYGRRSIRLRFSFHDLGYMDLDEKDLLLSGAHIVSQILHRRL